MLNVIWTFGDSEDAEGMMRTFVLCWTVLRPLFILRASLENLEKPGPMWLRSSRMESRPSAVQILSLTCPQSESRKELVSLKGSD